MKRLIAVISGLLVLPAFAEVVPQYYFDEMLEYADEEMTQGVEEDSVVEAETTQEATETKPSAVTSARNGNTGRVTASRAITAARQAPARNRTSTSRAVTARTATPTRVTTSRATASRAAGTPATQQTTRRQATTGANTARASIVQTDTVNSPLYTGRVAVRGSSNISSRTPTIQISNNTSSVSVESAAQATNSLNDLAEMTDFCKAQYTACMDNFCNVLDENQGRCSCSANIKNYAKTEEALEQATESLQDVAQKIQYIGLSEEEVTTIFSQTEAELSMQGASDNSDIKSDLDKIKRMILDVKSGTATATDTGLNLDLSGLLDFSLSSTGFDISTLLGTNNSTSSITNQRGEQLFKTAVARCRASVLNTCIAQGVDANTITNAYDIEIDKHCIAYERSLTEANSQMSATVRNAQSVLQKARLLVAQQKNSYDMRGCINALDACMQDDFACGSDYEYCVDPTGKYIVNGEVVVGSLPGKPGDVATKNGSTAGIPTSGLYYDTWEGNNSANYPWYAANNGNNSLTTYITATIDGLPVNNSASLSRFLQHKIGYNSEGRNYGMCMSVLNKCQSITYDKNGDYDPENSVVKEYLHRVLTQIRAQQDTILADHGENCLSTVDECLRTNGYTESASDNTKQLAAGACKSVAETCASVTGKDLKGDVTDWIRALMNEACPSSATGTYPNCQCATGTTYNPNTNECAVTCVSGSTGYYPDCKCSDSKTYNRTTNTCS